MKTLILSLFLAGFASFASAQTEDPTLHKKETQKAPEVKTVMPEFPGGETAMQKFIVDNLKYPETAVKDGVEGKVYLRFTVDKRGQVTDVRLLKGVRDDLDKEAMRVVKMMPEWKPGTQDGKAADLPYALPVNYVLPKKPSKK